MLMQLNIINFTLIDQLELELEQGMTVITGETGAGKSIIIDALDIILGNRADTAAIKQGAERCDISAVFDVKRIPAAQTWLTEHDFSNDECILRRVINRDGRSKNYINGQTVTAQMLRELADYLVNIHGQHEHQLLLKRDEQRRLLDSLAGHQDLLQEVIQSYHNWQTQVKALAELQAKQTDRSARSDWLRYQLHELAQLNLQHNELLELEQEQKQLAHADRLLENSQTALNILNENEVGNVMQGMHQARTRLESLITLAPSLQDTIELLNQAEIQLTEAVGELTNFCQALELNPERLENVEQRLQAIHELARKHRVQPNELLQRQQELTSELAQLDHSESYLDNIQKQLEINFAAYMSSAKKLSASRQRAAKKLATQVTQQLPDLGITGGQFNVSLAVLPDDQVSAHGLERVEFMVSTNPGQALQPLQKVASGGELSRISLAIQVIAANADATPTLVFDEVDVGVGGVTAAVIGQLLKRLSERAQVLCITHLPQVAAYGAQHLHVEKTHAKNATYSEIKLLSDTARIEEIARMLGGLKITKQTLAHAQELLDTAI